MKPLLLLAACSVLAMAQSAASPDAAPRTPTADEQSQLNSLLKAKAAKALVAVKTGTAQPRDSDTPPPMSPVLLTQVSQSPVQFTLTPSDCSLLKASLTGTGVSQTTMSLVRNASAGFNYTIVTDTNGTAVDAKGFHYIFNYRSTNYVNGGKGVQGPEPPYSFVGPDMFDLIPLDGGVAYGTRIYFKAKIAADGSFVDLGSVANANPNCDPI